MKVIHTDEIIAAVERLCIEANYFLGEDVLKAFERNRTSEESPLGKNIFTRLIENAEIARKERVPICQDTGLTVIFVELGQDMHIEGMGLTKAINQGVRQGYVNGFLRKSIVQDPTFNRVNTRDNTPAVIHYDIVPGDLLKISVAPKGFGSENMGNIKMMKPSEGIEGIINFVVDTVDRAGGNPCPPIIVGVGVGGNMEKAAIIAKKSLLRTIGEHNPDPNWSKAEDEILDRINKLGIGPQGLGGTQTALAVFIDTFPTHLAGMPVAVNINCHAARHKYVELTGRETIVTEGSRVIQTPLTKEKLTGLKAGDAVLISGTIYTGRDAAHKKIVEAIDNGEELPFDIKDQIIYYMGPSPGKPGQVIGSAGPTTSYRMDSYAPKLIAHGLTGMLGKGLRSPEVIKAMKEYGAVYFVTTGGAGAYLSKCIKSEEVVAYPELGPEKISKLIVEDLPAIVAIDANGNNIYELNKAKYRR
jgi:fumarate hydratase subunit alpha